MPDFVLPPETVVVGRDCPWMPACAGWGAPFRDEGLRSASCEPCLARGRSVACFEIRNGLSLAHSPLGDSTIRLALKLYDIPMERLDGVWWIIGPRKVPLLWAVTLATPAEWAALASGLVAHVLVPLTR